MGADYYTSVNLRIKFKKKEDGKEVVEFVQLSQDRGYWTLRYDSDSEDGYENAVNKYLQDYVKRNPSKVLYQDGEWKITSQEKIKRYEREAKAKMEEGDELLEIKKFHSIWERN